jgi:pimeloyl-ACP methyl ester carboxylesterase
MNRRSIIARGAGLAAACSLLVGTFRYRRWKQHVRQRLQSESSLLETSRGIVEYYLEGTGPTVLVLHGSPGGYDQSVVIARLLNLKGFSVLSLSRPGYRRTPLSSGQTPEAQADLFASALDALNIAQVRIVAVSGGGPSALEFASRYPQRCRGLMMVAALSQSYAEEAVYRSLPPRQRLLKRLFDQLLFWNPFLFLLVGLSKYVPGGAQGIPFIESCAMNSVRSPGYRNDMQQFANLSPALYADVGVPMLIVHGTADVDVPFNQAQELARAVSSAQLVSIEGANHLSVLAGEQATIAIQNFLQGLPSEEGEESTL